MTPQSRRRFLQNTLGSSALISAGLTVPSFVARSAQALAAEGPKRDNVLVIVQLSGGNDGLNTVIPYTDPAYTKNRILLRIGRGQALTINRELGFHPRMEGFAQLLEENQLCIVQGVGYPNPNRSHFESMDIWHTASRGEQRAATGWLGRVLDNGRISSGHDVPALYLGKNELPLALAARRASVPSINSLDSFRVNTRGGAVPAQALRTVAGVPRPADGSLLDFVRRSTLHAFDASEKVQQALRSERGGVDYPGFGLAEKLRNVARLIDAGLKTRIYYVTLDGFDTHANQANAHAGLVAELAASLRAFTEDLKKRGQLDRVLVMSFSEFGRRVRENASAGTDHGAAAPMFLAGGKVNSGPLGPHPSLTDLDRGDLKFHTDFRQIYATLLDRWLGADSERVLAGKFEHVKVLA